MSAFLFRLGRICARHPFRVIGIWLVAAVAISVMLRCGLEVAVKRLFEQCSGDVLHVVLRMLVNVALQLSSEPLGKGKTEVVLDTT